MSPDIDWQVGEDKDQEIIHAPAPLRSRQSWIAIVIVVILGAGLGMAYRSLPEPPPRPSPVFSPMQETASARPAIPAALFQTIDREAQALADGDFETYRAIHPPTDADILLLAMGHTSPIAWGRPGNDDPLYEIVDFKFLNESQAWADIRQFRNGCYFRVTRFYRRFNDRWQSTSRFAIGSGQDETLQTPHFDVVYSVGDHDVLSPTLKQMEEDYQSLCHDLGCTTLGHELTFTVRMTHANVPFVYSANTIWMPSPRVAGYYESGRAYVWNNNPVHWILAQSIVEQVYGKRGYDQPGGGLVWAGTIWAVERIDPLPPEFWNERGNLTPKSLLPLETLWELGAVNEPGMALNQLNWLLRFIEQEYGAAAVTRLLSAVGSAKSMSEAIEFGLGVPFAEFDQKWQAWVKANLTTR